MEKQQEATQQQFQMDLAIVQIKLNLLALSKDMIKESSIPMKTVEDMRLLYLDLREEVLGIPNPNNEKENGG